MNYDIEYVLEFFSSVIRNKLFFDSFFKETKNYHSIRKVKRVNKT